MQGIYCCRLISHFKYSLCILKCMKCISVDSGVTSDIHFFNISDSVNDVFCQDSL